jgi:dienelactone hydrolase
MRLRRAHNLLLSWTVLATLVAPGAGMAQSKVAPVYRGPLIEGFPMDSPEMTDSLSRPYWRALAGTPCPRVAWNANVSNLRGLPDATAPIMARLKEIAGTAFRPAGYPYDRRVLYRGPRYSIDRIVFSDRTPGSITFGYLARPTPVKPGAPIVILLHGTGLHPQEAFGLDVSGNYRQKERADSASFVKLGLELVEAGYVVFVPWLGDSDRSDSWPFLPWANIEKMGGSMAGRLDRSGPYQLLMNQISGAVDYLIGQLPEADAQKVAIVGWQEGASLASVVAAYDPRISAVVRLEAPLDRHALRSTALGVVSGATFSHVDCALGDEEMAALVAPRPLLYTYSTRDASVAEYRSFESPTVMNRIRSLYQRIGRGGAFAVQGDTAWTMQNARRMREWLDAAIAFVPRLTPDTIVPPKFTGSNVYTTPWIDSTRLSRARFVAQLGPCIPPPVHPSFRSIPEYMASVEPLRRAVASHLRAQIVTSSAPITVVKRYVVDRQPGYTVEFISLSASRSTLPVMGLLATPNGAPAQTVPAVVSFDADVGLGRPFDLPQRENFPYLHGYAADLASKGMIVFAPFVPTPFPAIAPGELQARQAAGLTSFSLILAMYSGAVDFLLAEPTVDPKRIGAWGISYAGVVAQYATALDSRITSLVYSNPIVTQSVLFATADSPGLAPWWGEACSTADQSMTYLIAPRRFIRENGVKDANGNERVPLETINAIRGVYHALGLDDRFDLIRRSSGHETFTTGIHLFATGP